MTSLNTFWEKPGLWNRFVFSKGLKKGDVNWNDVKESLVPKDFLSSYAPMTSCLQFVTVYIYIHFCVKGRKYQWSTQCQENATISFCCKLLCSLMNAVKEHWGSQHWAGVLWRCNGSLIGPPNSPIELFNDKICRKNRNIFV